MLINLINYCGIFRETGKSRRGLWQEKHRRLDSLLKQSLHNQAKGRIEFE